MERKKQVNHPSGRLVGWFAAELYNGDYSKMPLFMGLSAPHLLGFLASGGTINKIYAVNVILSLGIY